MEKDSGVVSFEAIEGSFTANALSGLPLENPTLLGRIYSRPQEPYRRASALQYSIINHVNPLYTWI